GQRCGTSERPILDGGTDGSNPVPSRGESATNCSGGGLRWSAACSLPHLTSDSSAECRGPKSYIGSNCCCAGEVTQTVIQIEAAAKPSWHRRRSYSQNMHRFAGYSR